MFLKRRGNLLCASNQNIDLAPLARLTNLLLTSQKVNIAEYLHKIGYHCFFSKVKFCIGLISKYQVYFLKWQAIFPDLLSNLGQVGHRNFFQIPNFFFNPHSGNLNFPPSWSDLGVKLDQRVPNYQNCWACHNEVLSRTLPYKNLPI